MEFLLLQIWRRVAIKYTEVDLTDIGRVMLLNTGRLDINISSDVSHFASTNRNSCWRDYQFIHSTCISEMYAIPFLHMKSSIWVLHIASLGLEWDCLLVCRLSMDEHDHTVMGLIGQNVSVPGMLVLCKKLKSRWLDNWSNMIKIVRQYYSSTLSFIVSTSDAHVQMHVHWSMHVLAV